MVGLCHHLHTEIGAVVRAKGVTENLEKCHQKYSGHWQEHKLPQMSACRKGIRLFRGIQNDRAALTSNFSELCMPGIDCMRCEVGWFPKSELT